MQAIAINAWLKSQRNYQQGLDLVRAIDGVDETDLWLLELGETSVSRASMAGILEAAHARLVRERLVQPEAASPLPVLKAEAASASKAPQRDVSNDGYTQLVATMPPDLVQLRDDVREWAREMNYLRYPERMEKLASDEERLRDALRVVELDGLITAAYARLDAWRDTGRDPGAAAPAATPKNIKRLLQDLKNIESYLSRHRSNKRPASAEKVAEWEKQKEQLKGMVDALQA